MVYRKTEKSIRNAAICARMREGKARKRIEGEAPDYPKPLPDLRRTIIVIDYDRGLHEQHQIDLYRTRGSYASGYFKDKWDLLGCIAKYRSALPTQPTGDV